MFSLNKTTMIIYKITNIVNGKVYIGQSQKTFNERYDRKGEGVERVFLQHKAAKECGRPYNIHLYNSMEKYGINNFTVEIIEQCKTVSKLNTREKYYIKMYNSADPDFGYNVQLGGGSKKYTTKMKKERLKQKREKEINQHSFLFNIYEDDIIYTKINYNTLNNIGSNMRIVYILLNILYEDDIVNVDINDLVECLPKRGKNRTSILINALDKLKEKNIIDYHIVEDFVIFKVLIEGDEFIELVIDYHLNLLASLSQYSRFLKKETVLKKCQRCGRLVCVLKTAANTKYCEYCRKEVNKEKQQIYKKKQKNKHPQS